MRILFISGVEIGGSTRSTYELARMCATRGHAVATLVRSEQAPRRTYVHRRLLNASVKLQSTPIGPFVDRIARRVGRKLTPVPQHRHTAWTAVRPENALAEAVARHRPDVVVVNSIELPAWRQIRADLAAAHLPAVLYIREENGLLHLSHSKLPPDLLLCNAEGHAAAAADMGYEAVVVPSIIDCATCAVDTTRERVLFINPVPMYGVDIALELATRRPDVPFAFVESWPLGDDEFTALEQQLATRPNVELRRFIPNAQELYRDARVLLVPYRYPGRSRVVAEAHCSGIPVIASNLYGIAEAVGPGGVLVDPDGPLEPWAAALAGLWDDADAYDATVTVTRAFSARAEIQPAAILATFETALEAVIAERAARP